MRRLTTILFLCTIGLLGAACTAPADTFAIRDVRLFDGDVVLERATVLVEKGRIAAVAEDLELPRGITVIDGCDKTLLPGLIDSHTHAFNNALEDALRFGVTTELDMFTDHRWAAERRREQEAGPVTNRADLFSSGTLVTAPGGHGTEYPIEVPTLDAPEHAADFVQARLDEGSDYIKIVYDDGASYGLSFPTLDRATLQAVIRAAHQEQALAVVHVGSKQAALEAISAGADGLAHVFADQAIDNTVLEAAVKHGIFVVPTLSVIESLGDGVGGAAIRDDPHLGPLLGAEQHRTLGVSFPMADSQRSQLAVAEDAVIRLHRAGVPILAGTDAPNPGTAHGASLHRELELLVAAGLQPMEALRAATSGPADAFGLGDRGRIAPGLKADLLLVDGNPLADITASRDIVAIWKDGAVVDRTPPQEAAAQASTGPLTRLKAGLVSDFEDGTMHTTTGFGWSPSTDSMMGGTSTVEFEVTLAEDGGRHLRIQGSIAAGSAFPWAGVILFPGEQPMTPVDGTSLTGLRFKAQGEVLLRILVFAESLGWIPAEHQVQIEPAWKEYAIPFSAFAGVETNAIKAVLFSGGPGLGDFEFAIDEVGFDES